MTTARRKDNATMRGPLSVIGRINIELAKWDGKGPRPNSLYAGHRECDEIMAIEVNRPGQKLRFVKYDAYGDEWHFMGLRIFPVATTSHLHICHFSGGENENTSDAESK